MQSDEPGKESTYQSTSLRSPTVACSEGPRDAIYAILFASAASFPVLLTLAFQVLVRCLLTLS